MHSTLKKRNMIQSEAQLEQQFLEKMQELKYVYRSDIRDLDALEKMSDEEAMTELTKLYGVGVKVAGCMLLFGLHRLNVFPVDVWIRRAVGTEYPFGYPMEKYAPYNGVYQQYMFAYYRNGKSMHKTCSGGTDHV